MKKLAMVSIASLLLSPLAFAKPMVSTLENETCLSINQNISKITQLIDSGELRTDKPFNKSEVPDFSYDSAVPYSAYLAYASKLIAVKKPLAELPCPIVTATSQLLTTQQHLTEATKVKHLVAPFELSQPENKKAILLIHGLTDSPYLFHDLANVFYQQGFTVRTLMLPGHGTAPADLLDVSYKDWQKATDYAIARMQLDFEQVYLGGFSTGGALIFNHLMKQESVDEKIKGLLMWSPASKAKSDVAWLAGYIDYLPFVDWVDKDADIDFAKYESFSFNAGAQVHKLMSKIIGEDARKNNHVHNIPLFVVASQDDQTIETKMTIELMNVWQKGKTSASSTNTLVYYGDETQAKKVLHNQIKLISPECDAASNISNNVSSDASSSDASLCRDVFDIAHTATTNAPTNPHYGKDALYRNCGHYLTDLPRYQLCKTSKNVIKGELTEANLQRKEPMQRLTYNPYFDEMVSSIAEFLASIE